MGGKESKNEQLGGGGDDYSGLDSILYQLHSVFREFLKKLYLMEPLVQKIVTLHTAISLTLNSITDIFLQTSRYFQDS